jgi:asparagine synthase (glutamine-hydrolysing)
LSGFAGILNLDGAPVDRNLVDRLTRTLAFRGPDGQQVWCDGAVGLGHTLLRATQESAAERQPFNIGHDLWIVADARVDARAELIDQLNANLPAGRRVSLATPDVELILVAYERWGEACVEHLIGDFSFAIWDAREGRLFCARDQFGVKPFFYAHMGSCIIFSNTLDCVRLHPSISSRLNDLAIADFLLFDANQDPATTSFADIQRLPPAHILTCERGKISARRYWELSVTTPVHYSRDAEYVEHFRELLDTAVAERLRTESAGVLMSGGLDSSTVAASAQRIFTRSGVVSGVHAYTQVFDKLIRHEERYYAELVANALKIPILFLPNDDWRLFEYAELPEYSYSEPTNLAWPDTTADYLRRAAARSRVVLTGDGGDPGFSSRISIHFRQLIEKRQFGPALGDAIRYLSAERRFSRLYLRTRWRLAFASKNQTSQFPEWLNQDFQNQHHLRDRWESQIHTPACQEAVRPEAQGAMDSSMWPDLFEAYDPGMTRVAVEVRHPFFDLRLVNFLLALPRLPWCSDKELLREHGRGVLPEVVRLRPKSPLRSDPLISVLSLPEASWVDRFEPVPELARYVVRDRIPPVQGEKDSSTAWIHLRPMSLNFWLRRRDK